tara:strand:+ start:3858 stop:4568 length:711 start_codon:yes stop_codon:yes gene_type:complete
MKTCIILCGGYGKRAREIDNKLPKILIRIQKEPLLFWILKNLEKKKIKKIILCVGYKSNHIKSYLKKNKKKFKVNIILVYENENNLLGTGGAIKNSLKHVKTNDFFVMYGDTFLFFDINKMFDKYKKNKKPILMSIYKNNNMFYKNNIKIDGKLIYDKYDKKNKYDYIDYGLIIMNKKVFNNQPLKFDLSSLLKENSLKSNVSYFKIKKKFLEIGTLYSYKNTLKNFFKVKNEIYR